MQSSHTTRCATAALRLSVNFPLASLLHNSNALVIENIGYVALRDSVRKIENKMTMCTISVPLVQLIRLCLVVGNMNHE